MLRKTTAPFIPDVINPEILSQGRLVSPKIIAQIQVALENGTLQPGRMSKTTLKNAGIHCNHSIIALNKDEIYVICPGEKQGMLLGRGTYGSVKLVQNSDGEFLVLKLQKQNEKNKEGQLKETAMLQQAGQKVRSITYQSPSKKAEMYAVIMPLAHGEEGVIPQKMAPIRRIDMCINAIHQLNELHTTRGILHLDIKPENLMIDPVTGGVTIIDFGTSLTMNSKGTADGKLVGSPLYMANELLAPFMDVFFRNAPCPTLTYTAATDTYSLGLALANMLGLAEQTNLEKGFPPYIVTQANSEAFNRNQILPDPLIRKEVLQLLTEMTAKKPEDRPSLASVEEKFNALFIKMNNSTDNKLKIALLDVNEFKYLSESKQVEILKQLKAFDQVQLISTTDSMDIDLATNTIRRLDNSLIPVRRTVFHKKETIENLAIEVQSTLKNEKIQSIISHVTQKPMKQAASSKLAAANITSIIITPETKTTSTEDKIFTESIQSIPKKIDRKDLQGGRLLSEKNISKLKAALEEGKILFAPEKSGIRITKTQLKKLGIKSKYNIYVVKGDDNSFRLFAAYKGQEKALGQGAFGKVKIVQDLDTGDFFAAKAQNAPGPRDRATANMIRKEIKNLGIVKQLAGDLSYQAVAKKGTPSKPDRNLMIMKLGEGAPLSNLNISSLNETEIFTIAVSVLESIADLHKNRLLHADLKPDNIMYSINGATLIDMGTCIELPNDSKEITIFAVGTRDYLPPEIIEGKGGTYSERTDIYSYAISMAKIFGLSKDGVVNGQTRLILVSESDDAFKMNTIIKNPLIRKQLLDCLIAMTNASPENRPTIADGINVLKKILSDVTNSPSGAIKTAIIDIAEFKKMTSDERKELIDMLANYRHVQVVCTNPALTVLEIKSYFRELTDNRINVLGHVVRGSNDVIKLAAEVKSLHSKSETDVKRDFTLVSGKLLMNQQNILIAHGVNLAQTETATRAESRTKKLLESKNINQISLFKSPKAISRTKNAEKATAGIDKNSENEPEKISSPITEEDIPRRPR